MAKIIAIQILRIKNDPHRQSRKDYLIREET
jgi:hypothetical protein